MIGNAHLPSSDPTMKSIERPRRSTKNGTNCRDSIDANLPAQPPTSPPRKRNYTRKIKRASEQEQLDLKREKNRIAASKCRAKSTIWEKNLEKHARRLQDNNVQLSLLLSSMRQEHLSLKEMIVMHSINSPNCSRRLLDSMAPDLSPATQASGNSSFSPPNSAPEQSVQDPWEDAMGLRDALGDEFDEMDQIFEFLMAQDT
jgi:hypothetical protein